MPHEKLFDQFGLYLSSLFYPDKICNEITNLIDNSYFCDPENEKKLMSFSPVDSLSSMQYELIKFAKPLNKNNDLLTFLKANRHKYPGLIQWVKINLK